MSSAAAPPSRTPSTPAGGGPVQQLSLFERLESIFPRRAPTPPLAPSPSPAVKPTAPAPSATTWPQHHVQLGEVMVAYRLRRARRRSIGFVIALDGLTVSAPRWVGLSDIERALHSKAAWILRKLVEQRERAQRTEAARIEWRDGICFPYLGEPLRIVLSPHTAGTVLEPPRPTESGAVSAEGERVLRLGLPLHATPAQIRDRVQSWLQRQARQLFQERCDHFAGPLGVRMTRLRLSSAQTRWGSASADGSIRLNWRLMHFGLATIDYVVAHELAHLREMNHSPAFWAVVRSVIPDLEMRKAQLRAPGLPLWD